jgi:hypothetical protein
LKADNSGGASEGFSDEHENHLDECGKLLDEHQKLRWSSVHLIGSGITAHINP